MAALVLTRWCSGKKKSPEWDIFVFSRLFSFQDHAGLRWLRSASCFACDDCCGSQKRSLSRYRSVSCSVLKKHGRLPGRQAVPGGIRQERPGFVQEVQRQHRQRLAADGHHGAGETTVCCSLLSRESSMISGSLLSCWLLNNVYLLIKSLKGL